uniref:E3 ubiquitin-protein ligase SINA-like 8 n=1 Tax=Arabidopsis thaliana TaxID=3702 RepID=SINL8_ARATH|nr:RecName: Full=E3 ubiquitin-protein ligase SINA-like 8; AltName: Full=RING-type E3 ubiquitin transferase SINA-like 8; AltName: Full=Seven in absentia-like protein 8 [Arabidopsis thaliana]
MVGALEALISQGHGGERVAKRQRSATLLDLDILDCPICCEGLTCPIFQCENGHLACSSCCPKLRNKCPACPMENILESILVTCPNDMFGCTESFLYGKKSTHEEECIFSLCSCPSLDCEYSGRYEDLYDHYKLTHISNSYWTTNCFRSSIPYKAPMLISDKIQITRVYEKKILFAVQCFRESCGVYVTVSCIAPSAPEVGQFSYQISYTVDEHTMVYRSPQMKRVRKVSFETPQENFMLIPHNLLRSELLDIKLSIVETSNQE